MTHALRARRAAFWLCWSRSSSSMRVFPFYYAIVSSLKLGHARCSRSIFGRAAPRLGNYVGGVPRAALRAQHPQLASSSPRGGRAVAVPRRDGRLRAGARRSSAAAALLLLTILAVSMFPQVAVLSGMFELVRAHRPLQHAARR